MDIDSILDKVLEKLINEGKLNDFLKQLAFTNNGARVFEVYGVLKDMKIVPELIVVKKCEILSATYRNTGNVHFRSSKIIEAWQYYNLALLYAPLDSECYILAIANRSAVLYHLKRFDECMNDIKKVLQSVNCSKELKDKLLKRQFLCTKEFSESESKEGSDKSFMESHFTLKSPRNPKYPCASDAVCIAFNVESGHHVVAKRDIDVGEIIVEEDAYVIILSKSQLLFSCSYCMSRTANLLPCDKCCFCFYCSDLCKERAWTFYHKYECSIIALLFAMKFTKLELTALRTVLKACCEHINLESLFNTIADAEVELNSEYRGCTKIDDEWIYDSQSYTAIHTLASNVDKRSPLEILQKAVSAAVFLCILMIHTDLLKEANEDSLQCIAGLLLHHYMTSSTNSINIGTIDDKYSTDITLGNAVYAFCSLFNHSCAPNVERMSVLGTSKTKLIARRFIKKGMQLYDTYGPLYSVDDLKSRRETLLFQYKFTCSCEACINNWPTIFNLKKARKLPEDALIKMRRVLNVTIALKLQMGHKETAKEIYKPLCELITILEDYAPCLEFHECQNLFRHISTMFEGSLSREYCKSIEWKIPV